MTYGSPRPAPGAWTPSARLVVSVLAVAVSVLLAAAVAIAALLVTGHRHGGTYHAGDCVVVASTTAGQLHAAHAACDTDPSFTVAKLTTKTGECAPNGYDRFGPPSADSGTGRLCLVPNLIVGHCYRLGVAVGMWNLVDCAGAGPATIKVADRLDTDDAQACGPASPLPPRSYPAPPRTYCLGFAA